MEIPSQHDINVYNSLDEQSAMCMDFLGKTIEQAEVMIRENPNYYEEGFLWMGPVAFRYYIQSAIRFMKSDAATGNSSFIHGFISSLEFRLENDSIELVPVAEQLAAICDYLIQRYERFNLNPRIYGNLCPQMQVLWQSFIKLMS
ncbi:MAG TPA: hypothetical protein DD473_27225 [Planctomycetaceae bacterium]|nr:hypothetical protein [Planctomycetaceae bacterium]